MVKQKKITYQIIQIEENNIIGPEKILSFREPRDAQYK